MCSRDGCCLFISCPLTVFVDLLTDLKNPEIVTLRNLTHESSGVYRCTASNDVGEENCIIEVKMQCEYKGGGTCYTPVFIKS